MCCFTSPILPHVCMQGRLRASQIRKKQKYQKNNKNTRKTTKKSSELFPLSLPRSNCQTFYSDKHDLYFVLFVKPLFLLQLFFFFPSFLKAQNSLSEMKASYTLPSPSRRENNPHFVEKRPRCLKSGLRLEQLVLFFFCDECVGAYVAQSCKSVGSIVTVHNWSWNSIASLRLKLCFRTAILLYRTMECVWNDTIYIYGTGDAKTQMLWRRRE